MGEKDEGKKVEEGEEEEVILRHSCHEHPLTLTKAESRFDQQCYGCTRYIFSGETVYKCRDNSRSRLILHEECAEMPRKITHSSHLQHTLVQTKVIHYSSCEVCEETVRRIGYLCNSPPCKFQIHVGCASGPDIIQADGGERGRIDHPSHPQHELTLLWTPGRAGSLRCGACGTIEKGNFYVCIVCQYSIHESCASLTPSETFAHHNHELSLVYNLPREYIMFKFKCDLCFKDLLPKFWAYHCRNCRYVVHIKCANRTSPVATSNIDAKDVITFPINNAVGELIEPFVRKLEGMLNMPDEKELVKGKYKFHNPNHQLRLISLSLPALHDKEEEEQQHCKNDCDDDDDDDEDDADDDNYYYGKVSKLVCDGCTEPIFESSCSSSNDKYSYSYISCEDCKFYLHLACFQLPLELTSSLTHIPNHKLILQTTPSKLDFDRCTCCRVSTNGLFYGCKKCYYFTADMKCISLPETIKLAAHPHHILKLLSVETTNEGSYHRLMCSACGLHTALEVCYRCDTCGVIFHSRCCLLPPQISNRRYDKHPLRLTFDATLNHPGEFYCDVCERQMNPKMWMYHCRECDVSVHPRCFPNVSDAYRNIKFGQRFMGGAALHSHPLVFQPLITDRKLRCDACHERVDYGTRGFRCSDECSFFVCFGCFNMRRSRELQAVDD